MTVSCKWVHLTCAITLLVLGCELGKKDSQASSRSARIETFDIQMTAAFGSVEKMNKLINEGLNVNETYHSDNGLGDFTLLFLSAQYRNIDMVNFLLTSGAEIDSPAVFVGITPLKIAVYNGHVEIVRDLVARGAAVNHTTIGETTYHGTPLTLAVTAPGKIETSFISYSLKEIEAGEKGYSFLRYHEMLMYEQYSDALLYKYRTSNIFLALNGGNRDWWFERYDGSNFGSRPFETIEPFPFNGPGYDKTISVNGEVIDMDLNDRYAKILEILFVGGADVNGAALNLETPLFFAVRSGNVRAIEMLVDSGVDVSRKNRQDETPLDIAVELKLTEAQRILEAVRK